MKKERVIIVFLCIAVLFLIVYYVLALAKYNVPFGEDESYGMYSCGFIKNVYHGRYISNFITILLYSVLPKSLRIHPLEFYTFYGPIVKAFCLFILFAQMSLFFYYKRNKDILLPVIIFVLYIWYQTLLIHQYQDILYCSFFGFTFPFIFFCLFWYKFIKLYDKENLSKKDNILMIFYAFLVGISTEFTFIVTFFALLSILLINRKLMKNFYLSFFSLSLGCFLYVMNPGFKSVFGYKPIYSDFESLYNGLVHIKPFIFSCVDLLIHEYFVYIFIITIFFVIILIQNNMQKINNNNLIFPFSLLFGSCVFNVFLISPPEFSADLNYFVYHFDLIIQFKITFIIIILYELNVINMKNKYKNLALIFIMIFLFFVFVKKHHVFINNYIHKGINQTVNKDSTYWQNRYIFEKVNLYTINKYNTLYIVPNGYDQDGISHVYFHYFYNIVFENVVEVESYMALIDYYFLETNIDISKDTLTKNNFRYLYKENT